MDNRTAVFMDDEAARQYVTMLKYWPVIKELDKLDFYKLKNGSVELHKDYLGNLSSIKEHKLISLARQQS
jgi:hypothetical protein